MKHLLATIFLLALVACAPANTHNDDPFEAQDPLKPMNEQVFAFNLFTDHWVIRPVAHTYHQLPDVVRLSIGNFLTNLSEPLQVVDTAFQGDFQGAGTSLWRFILNSTFGFAGLRDFAGENGLKYQDQDFGKTLGSWGIAEGPYLVLPIVGPSTVRNAGGYAVDWVADPVGWYESTWVDVGQATVNGIATRDDQDAIVQQLYYDSLEPYSATRAAYLQHEFNPTSQSGENR